jgi:transcriptional antiterminator RfaH
MAFWAAARVVPRQERLALHCLGLAGFEIYLPRLRELRIVRGRRVEHQPPLFPGYLFIWVELQWSRARWSPGISTLIMNGTAPARVPDAVITELRSREGSDGLIVLPKPRGLRRGDQVRIMAGVFAGQSGLYAGMRPRDRVAVLLSLLGSARKVELPRAAIESV